MSKTPKKLDIKKAVIFTSYKDSIKRNLVSFLINNYCKPKNKLYLFSRGKNLPKLFLLKLIIPAKYNNVVYDISLLIYFPINFPLVQPEIYFHKYCTIKINPKCLNYIDEESLKINYNIFFKWENNFQSFNNLIKEIYKQFNINIPIFTLNEKLDESKNNNFDCVLRKELCEEIEFKNIINKNINSDNKRIIQTEKNNKKNDANINASNLSNERENVKERNMQNKNNKINNIRANINNNNINHNFKRSRTIMENMNQHKNKLFNNEDKKDLVPFNENISKKCLKKLLILDLYPKILKVNNSINDSKNYLTKIKNDITKELNLLQSKEKQAKTIEKSMNLMQNEITMIDIKDNNIKDKINFSNLDSFLKINNKKFYILQAKQKSIEEYLLIIKKNLEKKNIDFKSGIKLTRKFSRELFYIKYKCLNLKGTNI